MAHETRPADLGVAEAQTHRVEAVGQEEAAVAARQQRLRGADASTGSSSGRRVELLEARRVAGGGERREARREVGAAGDEAHTDGSDQVVDGGRRLEVVRRELLDDRDGAFAPVTVVHSDRGLAVGLGGRERVAQLVGGPEALETVGELRIDLVVLDVDRTRRVGTSGRGPQP